MTPGNTHDAKVATLAINAVPPSEYLVADKGYDSNALRAWLIERGTTPAIPARSNRKARIEHDRKIASAMTSSACSAASRTGGASPHASTATSRPSWSLSPSPPSSLGGSNESKPKAPIVRHQQLSTMPVRALHARKARDRRAAHV
ncbi:transposase [Sphingopyxis sp. FD7]|uniref:transposase n=1 Tax=Sphingopyxis sp. FD7 TaxID=1914525 RepID=UPI003FA7AAFF